MRSSSNYYSALVLIRHDICKIFLRYLENSDKFLKSIFARLLLLSILLRDANNITPERTEILSSYRFTLYQFTACTYLDLFCIALRPRNKLHRKNRCYLS